MKFDLIRPCGNCPFRSDIHPYISAARVRDILGSAERRKWWPAPSFPCHKTIDYDVDDGERPRVLPTSQQCAGLMIMLHREGKPNDAMQLAGRLGLWDPSRLDMTAPVYASTIAAIKAHEDAERR